MRQHCGRRMVRRLRSYSNSFGAASRLKYLPYLVLKIFGVAPQPDIDERAIRTIGCRQIPCDPRQLAHVARCREELADQTLAVLHHGFVAPEVEERIDHVRFDFPMNECEDHGGAYERFSPGTVSRRRARPQRFAPW